MLSCHGQQFQTHRSDSRSVDVPERLPDPVQDFYLRTAFSAEGTRHEFHDGRQDQLWVRGKLLGNGSFGEVWLETEAGGNDASQPQVRAVKVIRRDEPIPAIGNKRELEAAANFSRHQYAEYFVQSYGWFDDPENVYLAMEYLPHGDLGSSLVTCLPETEAMPIISQILEGLDLMHKQHFVHRDLKPANILVARPGPDWWVKIADFGVTKCAREGSTVCRTRVGTQAYSAPELLGFEFPVPEGTTAADGSYTNAVDLWALGAITFRILTQQPIFENIYDVFEYADGFSDLSSQKSLLQEKGVGSSCYEFLDGLIQARPEARLGASQALQHAWLR